VLFIVPVITLGTEIVAHGAFFVVIHVLAAIFPVIIVDHNVPSFMTGLIVGVSSQLSLSIWIVDHESCD
jgi:hypothetical protein